MNNLSKLAVIVGPSLCLQSGFFDAVKSKEPPKPRPAPAISEAQAQRLLLNQVLITLLEANTRILTEQGVWPGKADKLIGVLHHRVNELYDRFYQHTSSSDGDWLNVVTNLTETAAVSILSLAMQNNAANTPAMYDALSALAQLAGLRVDDVPATSPVEAA